VLGRRGAAAKLPGRPAGAERAGKPAKSAKAAPKPSPKVAGPRLRRAGVPRVRFIGEIIAELKKVTWPSREDTTRLTAMVIVICLIVGAIMGVLDYGFTRLAESVFFR